MNRIVINIPKSSPENLVNLFRIAAALNIAMRNNITAVQMQTLSHEKELHVPFRSERRTNAGHNILFIPYHPAHGRNIFSPRFG